jgi:lactate dehydrogenase-like 2-hydroxyacid dehydrogenase
VKVLFLGQPNNLEPWSHDVLAGVGVVVDQGGGRGTPLDPGHPLLQLDNMVATPHVAGVTTGTSRRRTAAVAENVHRVAAGLPPLYIVATADG